MNLDYNSIGKRIAETRNAAGISQEELGQKIDMSTAAISLFESGERKISLELLSKIANILGVTLKELIEGYEKVPTYAHVSFRATEKAMSDPKFRKAFDEAIKKVNEGTNR